MCLEGRVPFFYVHFNKENGNVSVLCSSVDTRVWRRSPVVAEVIFWFTVVLHILVFCLLCLPSGVLAKWMLCLQHVLVLSSGGVYACVLACARVRPSGSAPLPWQRRLGKRVCVCVCVCVCVRCVCVFGVCSVCQFRGPAGLSEIVCVSAFVCQT